MATSAYGFACVGERDLIIVNGRPGDNHVDKFLVVDYGDSTIECLSVQEIKSVLSEPYKTFWVEFTTDDQGSVATARYVDGPNGPDSLVHLDEQAMSFAKLVLWLESFSTNGLSDPKVFETSVDISQLMITKEDEDKCVICHDEYQTDEMICTLHCEHSFHKDCIHQWLAEKHSCPICRAAVRVWHRFTE